MLSGCVSCRKKRLLVVSLILVFLSGVMCASACAGDSLSFSWLANPVDDAVLGYRLYCGSQSRSITGGYDYYLDFTAQERCSISINGTTCEPFAENDVLCEDLFGETPRCTITNISEKFYFAMTAYNSEAESDYTRELHRDAGVEEIVKITLALQQVYRLLLY